MVDNNDWGNDDDDDDNDDESGEAKFDDIDDGEVDE